MLTLNERRTQLALRDGSAMFDVGYLGEGDLFEVATPYGAVDFEQPGLYNVGIDNGQVLVSVLSGLAQVVGLGGSGQISKGEMLTLIGQTAADVVLSQIDGRDADTSLTTITVISIRSITTAAIATTTFTRTILITSIRIDATSVTST